MFNQAGFNQQPFNTPAVQEALFSASLSGQSGINADKVRVVKASAALSASSNLTAEIRREHHADVALSASATLSATVRAEHHMHSGLTAVAGISAKPRTEHRISAAVSATAGINADNRLEHHISAGMSATAGISGEVVRAIPGSLDMSASGDMSATGRRIIKAGAKLSATSSIAANNKLERLMDAALSATSSTNAEIVRALNKTADLSAGSGLSATMRRDVKVSAGLSGDAGWGTGYALSFDGVNDFVSCGKVDEPTEFTLECWINPTSTETSTKGIISNLAHDNGGLNKGIAVHHYSPTQIRINYPDDSGTYHRSTITVSAGFTLTNIWTHVAVTYKDQIIKVYINGILKNTTATAQQITTTGVTTVIGRWASTYANYYFHGPLREGRQWNVERSELDIQTDMLRRLNGDEPGLVGYWPLDDGTGTVAHDKAGNHNGTIIGATWIDNPRYPTITRVIHPDTTASGQGDLSSQVARIIPMATGHIVEAGYNQVGFNAVPFNTAVEKGPLSSSAGIDVKISTAIIISASLSATSSMAATAKLERRMQANLSADASLAATVNHVQANHAELPAEAGISATAKLERHLDAGLSAISDISATNKLERSLQAQLSAEAGWGRGHALSFDGVNDYVDIPRFLLNTLSSTLEIKLKINDIPDVGSILFSDRQGTLAFIGVNKNGNIRAETNTNNDTFGAAAFIQLNEEVMLSVTFDNRNFTWYVNGDIVGTGTVVSSVYLKNIGRDIDALNSTYSYPTWLDGIVYEVRRWDIPLSQTDIQENRNKRLAGNEPGLVSYWRMDEGAGTTIHDSAGSNDGTIHGPTWIEQPDYPTITRVIHPDAAMPAEGTLAAEVNRYIPLSASVSTESSMQATTKLEHLMQANLSASAGLDAHISRVQPFKAALSAASSISATLTRCIPYDAAMAAEASIGADATRLIRAGSGQSGESGMAGEVVRVITMSTGLITEGFNQQGFNQSGFNGPALEKGPLSSSGGIHAVSLVAASFSAQLSATSTLAATSYRQIRYSSSLQAEASLSADFNMALSFAAELEAEGGIKASASAEFRMSAELSASSTMSGEMVRGIMVDLALSADSALAAEMLRLIGADAALSAGAGLASTLNRLIGYDAELSAESHLLAEFQNIYLMQAELSARANMAADVGIVMHMDASLAAESDISVSFHRYIKYSASFAGESSIDAVYVRASPGASYLSAYSRILITQGSYHTHRFVFTGDLLPGETLIINPRYLRVVKGTRNARHLMQGDFILLAPGSNQIKYIDAGGNELAVRVLHRDRFMSGSEVVEDV